MRKRVYHILNECLQNVKHHAADDSATKIEVTENSIHTSNTIHNNDVNRVKEMLDKVNRLDRDELDELYKQTLVIGKFSEQGTAGLGFIEMARKSGVRLNYQFNRVDDKYSIFDLSITLKEY